MIRYKRIVIHPFGAHLWVFEGDCPMEEVVSWMQKRLSVDVVFPVESSWEACTTRAIGGPGLKVLVACMFSGATVSTGCIYHESLHAAYGILDAHGVPCGTDNQEIIAYMQGYIADEIIKFISK